MSYLRQIQAGVDHIEARLDDVIDLSSVAATAGLSQWHFARIFKSITGDTVKGYIRARRLAVALQRLSQTDLRILDIAVMAGYESQEAFCRAFKRAFGITPSDYRRNGGQRLFLEKVRIDTAFLEHLARTSREPQIEERGGLDLVGLRTVFFGAESEKNNIGQQLPPLWDEFMPRLGEINGRIDGVCYGALRPDPDEPEALEYLAAIETPGCKAADVPPGMVHWHVPSATYARFEHRGPARDIDRTVSYAYGTWLMQAPWRHASGLDLEIYDERWHPTDDSSVFEYALQVEPR